MTDRDAVLSAEGRAIDAADWTDLYRNAPAPDSRSTLTAVPYFLWANRNRGSMMVWIPEA